MELHRINNRGTPDEMCKYKHALQLYKLINMELPKIDWIDSSFQQILSTRFKTNKFNVRKNLLCKRFHILNGKVISHLMEERLETFKVYCYSIFL